MKWLKNKNKYAPIPPLKQQQAEKLSEIGTKLWTARQEQGFSLEEIVFKTKISRRLLQAIEEGNLNELPEPIYIQGLIKQFADALGLNGSKFSSTFPVGFNGFSLKPAWKNTLIGQLRPIHLYWLYIFLILCSVNGLSQLLNNASLQANSQNNQRQEFKSLVSPEQIQKTQTQKLQTVSNTISSVNNDGESVQISITLKASSWIRVVADGTIEFEGNLPKGTHRIWVAQEQLTVKAENAGGVMVSVNQQEAKQLGNPGEVQEMTIATNPRL